MIVTNLPDDPMSVLASQANMLHELYESYLAAGFTRDEALYVIATVACGGPRPPSNPPAES